MNSEQTYTAAEATWDAQFIAGWFLQRSPRSELEQLLEACEEGERDAGASWVREALRRKGRRS